MANVIFSALGALPEWIGGAIVAAIGWLAKTLYDRWMRSRIPFAQDRTRLETILNTIDPGDLFYFQAPVYSAIPMRHVDGLFDAEEKVESLRRSTCLNRRLREKEETFQGALASFNIVLLEKVHCHPGNTTARIGTIWFCPDFVDT